MDEKPRITSGGIILKGGKILLGKRKKDRLYPDIWDIFGGHVEDNETLEETLKRELAEEVGIEVDKYEFLDRYQDKEPTFGFDYVHNIFIVNSFSGTPSNLNENEHESIGWFSKTEIKDLKMHDEVKRIILENVDF